MKYDNDNGTTMKLAEKKEEKMVETTVRASVLGGVSGLYKRRDYSDVSAGPRHIP
jgi:hypothetical protein